MINPESRHMPLVARIWLLLGSLGMLSAVAMGAFGAHGLKNTLTPELMIVYQTAVHYHCYHALGLLVVGLLTWYTPTIVLLRWSGILMIAGIVLFSGSLYILSITGIRWLGAITPLGGLSFIGAWLLFALAVLKAD